MIEIGEHSEGVYFASFGTGNWHLKKATKRIYREASLSGFFSETFVYTDVTLFEKFPEIENEIRDLRDRFAKGYGLYLWKILMLKEILSIIPINSVLVYLDAGCHINFGTTNAHKNFRRYIHKLDSQPIVAFQIRENQFQDHSNFSEKFWSKKELIEYFSLDTEDSSSNQIESGVILFRNDNEGRDFVERWLATARLQDYTFIQDGPIVIDGRVVGQNRHDQSVFSCLFKSMKYKPIANETYFPDQWSEAGNNFPFWTIRNRTGIRREFHILDLPERFILRINKSYVKVKSKILQSIAKR